ncbi:MAG: hypothetical protein OXH36_03010 [Bdellovibrionales bacterium]|nr:hypothetical protein [Bdellovibrionales bacterium]
MKRQNDKNFFYLSCRGSLTVQFLLGFILFLSFVMLFSVMTLTLAVSEITQYITYASSRKLFLGDGDKGLQQKSARKKYHSLVKDNQHLSKFFTGANKLFEIEETGGDLREGDGLGLNSGFSRASGKPYLFYGVWTKFIPKVLEVDTLWGSTEEDAAFFETVVGSYLGREPTKVECEEFIEKRWEFIINKHISTGGTFPANPDPANRYQEDFGDNRC